MTGSKASLGELWFLAQGQAKRLYLRHPKEDSNRQLAYKGRFWWARMPKHLFNPASVSASGGKSLAFKSATILSVFFCAYSIAALLIEPFLFLTLGCMWFQKCARFLGCFWPSVAGTIANGSLTIFG